VAAGDGLEYCILIISLRGEDPVRVCRDYERTPTSAEVRSPSFAFLENPLERESLEKMTALQEVGELWPSFDRLLLGEDGELWVRTVGEEMAGVHPWVRSRRPELAPSLRSWDVFSRERALEKTVRLPSTFDPRVVRGDTVMGFYELPTGEITIARVDLTAKTMK